MKVTRESSGTVRRKGAAGPREEPRLPHESDQAPDSQQEHEPRGIGKQAHRDVERGLEDTDRWGGDAYQKRTQNDAHADRNSRIKRRKES
jgi:hypothetical protein